MQKGKSLENFGVLGGKESARRPKTKAKKFESEV